MTTLAEIISTIKYQHVMESEVSMIPIHRFEEDEKPFLFSKKIAEQVAVHIVDDRYIRCPGEGCPLCASGKKRFLSSVLFLFPAYSLADSEMGVVRSTDKMYPGSLLSQLVPILDRAEAHIVWIARESKKFSLRLEKHSEDGLDEALSALDDFEKDVVSGVIDIKNVINSISPAELQAAVSKVSRWVR